MYNWKNQFSFLKTKYPNADIWNDFGNPIENINRHLQRTNDVAEPPIYITLTQPPPPTPKHAHLPRSFNTIRRRPASLLNTIPHFEVVKVWTYWLYSRCNRNPRPIWIIYLFALCLLHCLLRSEVCVPHLKLSSLLVLSWMELCLNAVLTLEETTTKSYGSNLYRKWIIFDCMVLQ